MSAQVANDIRERVRLYLQDHPAAALMLRLFDEETARLEEQNRRLQVRIEDAEIHNRRLRSELDRTKAELELVTAERDSALLRLDELGSEL